jgi:flavin reductase (DIM6/NTAB) family NADH-FMN oxidoreductase RutF
MKLIAPPNPGWRPGIRAQSPVSGTVSIDPKTLNSRGNYKLLNGAIVPRPIAFVTTRSDNGAVNAAPFSSFNLVASDPASVVFSIARKRDGTKKDTLVNIERSREFVVNTVSVWMVEAINHCSAEYPYGVSELELVGLSPIASEVVSPPRVQESPIQMECRVHSLVEVGPGDAGSSTVIIGEVLRFHVATAAYKEGGIDLEGIQPVGRLDGVRYGLIGDMFDLDRPR